MNRILNQLMTASFVLALACIVAVGCASSRPKRTGFLNDYTGFRVGPKDGADLVYIKPDVDWKSYDKVMIDSVLIWFSQDAEYRGINPYELQQLADYFREAIIRNLEDAYSIADEPGPNTMRLRVAITDVIPTNPELDAATAHIPHTRLLSELKKATTGSHLYVGGASLEAELLDSQTQERLVAAIVRRYGEKKLLQIKDKWSDVREIMDYLARRFRQRLDEEFVVQS